MTANRARQELHSKLLELEVAARTERTKQGLTYSRREVAKAAEEAPFNTSLDHRRISSWVPTTTAAEAQVPYDDEPGGFLAVVQVWSAWAGKRYRQREWKGLLANARRERKDAPPPAAALRTTLPPSPGGFSGRTDDLDTVLDALASGAEAPTAVCVAGPPGVGKTALALVAAHQAQEGGLFTTALFVDLLGHHDAPADPADLLAILLRGIDADVSVAGSSAAEREAAYRCRLAELARTGHPVLIVADDAADADAVRPLLPPSGPHRLLVTSRHTLHTLDARLIGLPVLPDDASVGLLATALRNADPVDVRIAPDASEALTALARLCGGLPLALRIAAALLIREPHLAATDLAEELIEVGPMEGLDDGEHSVCAALELSYRRLSPELAEVFRLLVLNPGPDLSTEAAEVLTGLRHPVLRRRLAELARAHLVDGARVAGRWQMHDLVRAFVTDRIGGIRPYTGDEEHGRAQQQRLLRYYQASVNAADIWIRGFTPTVPASEADASGTEARESFADRQHALAWLDAEHVNLVGAVAAAAATGTPDVAVSLALGVAEYLQVRLLRAEAAWVLGIAQQVAPTSFERAQLLDTRGNVLTAAQQFDEAITLHEQALELFRDQGSQREEGIALMNIGIALRNASRPKEAIDHHRQARTIFQRIGPAYYLAAAWNNLASAWLDDQAFGQAVRAADKAIDGFRICGNTTKEVTALFNRYRALSGLGHRHRTEALDAIRLALARSADAMVPPHERGQLLMALADALQATGHPEQERRAAFEAAAAAFDEAKLPGAGDIARQFAERSST
ncbi:MAG: tetratricopeptide repeat protein [Pseudonocardiaceae bacterium]